MRLLENIRARIPNVALRTTFIVGFPGETAEDFAELEGFIEEIGFDHVGVFTYSHEEGTSAHDLTDDVPAATKKKRQDRLMARQRDIVAARQQARIGERTRLVVDGQSPEHELVLQGRLPGQAPEIDPVVYLTECDPSLIAEGLVHRRGDRRRRRTTTWSPRPVDRSSPNHRSNAGRTRRGERPWPEPPC